MPTPINRQSLTTDLASRYVNQNVGGSQNAKRAGTSTIEPSINAKLFDTSTKYDIDQSLGQSNFKGIVNGGQYKEISRFATGISTVPYDK